MSLKKSFSITYILLSVLTLVVIIFIHNTSPKFTPPEQNESFEYEHIHGGIVQFLPQNEEDGSQQVLIEANSGEEEGRQIRVLLNQLYNYNNYEKGDEVLIYKQINSETNEATYEISDYYHQSGLFYLFIIFSIITILIARSKGITAIASVLVSLLLFYFIFLKSVALGYNPLIASIVFVLLVTGLTIPLIHGFNKKSLSALISITIGYIASLAIVYFSQNIAQLGNTPGEDFRTLFVFYPDIQISHILLASLFLGAVGALIDTAISIASAIFEALKEHTNMPFKKVYKIGMEVGKDILGSMTNTLLFAYLASALPFFILLTLSYTNKQGALSELINLDFIALELTRTFIGALSLVIIIPIVASLSAYFLVKAKETT